MKDELCETCRYEPTWEEYDRHKAGTCIKDGEPIILYKGVYYAEVCGDSVAVMKRCSNYSGSKQQKENGGG